MGWKNSRRSQDSMWAEVGWGTQPGIMDALAVQVLCFVVRRYFTRNSRRKLRTRALA
ncbi:hypothetical protein BJY00DRAFT_171870 [Aspergillus carlsbadensis]|nr:hypothetical protein BJY00DRAFT_171870 [Aspergillus carlsbadensis]